MVAAAFAAALLLGFADAQTPQPGVSPVRNGPDLAADRLLIVKALVDGLLLTCRQATGVARTGREHHMLPTRLTVARGTRGFDRDSPGCHGQLSYPTQKQGYRCDQIPFPRLPPPWENVDFSSHDPDQRDASSPAAPPASHLMVSWWG